jgi:hypothetical protein
LFAHLAQELLRHICGVALPEIKRLISDEGLRDSWLPGQAGGLSERQRLSKLETLLRAIGPVQHLSELGSDQALALEGEFDELATNLLRDAGFTEQSPLLKPRGSAAGSSLARGFSRK